MDKLEIAKLMRDIEYDCPFNAMKTCPATSFCEQKAGQCRVSKERVDAYISEHEEKPMYEKVAIEGKPHWCEIGVMAEFSDDNECWEQGLITGYDPCAEPHYMALIGMAGRDSYAFYNYARPITKWQPKEGEAVMVWCKSWDYVTVYAYTESWVMAVYDHIAKYDGRLDLRVSEIGPEVPRLK